MFELESAINLHVVKFLVRRAISAEVDRVAVDATFRRVSDSVTLQLYKREYLGRLGLRFDYAGRVAEEFSLREDGGVTTFRDRFWYCDDLTKDSNFDPTDPFCQKKFLDRLVNIMTDHTFPRLFIDQPTVISWNGLYLQAD